MILECYVLGVPLLLSQKFFGFHFNFEALINKSCVCVYRFKEGLNACLNVYNAKRQKARSRESDTIFLGRID